MIKIAEKEHEVIYQDLVKLISKHKDKVNAEEMLAIAANMLGKLLALQDQRTMSKDRAMKTIIQNIESGNAEIVNQLKNTSSKIRN